MWRGSCEEFAKRPERAAAGGHTHTRTHKRGHYYLVWINKMRHCIGVACVATILKCTPSWKNNSNRGMGIFCFLLFLCVIHVSSSSWSFVHTKKHFSLSIKLFLHVLFSLNLDFIINIIIITIVLLLMLLNFFPALSQWVICTCYWSSERFWGRLTEETAAHPFQLKHPCDHSGVTQLEKKYTQWAFMPAMELQLDNPACF